MDQICHETTNNDRRFDTIIPECGSVDWMTLKRNHNFVVISFFCLKFYVGRSGLFEDSWGGILYIP